MTWVQSPFKQCDACARMTTRVHRTIAAQTETTACDECFGYDPAAYGEEPARYMSVKEYEGLECEYCGGWLSRNRLGFMECDDCGRVPSLCR